MKTKTFDFYCTVILLEHYALQAAKATTINTPIDTLSEAPEFWWPPVKVNPVDESPVDNVPAEAPVSDEVDTLAAEAEEAGADEEYRGADDAAIDSLPNVSNSSDDKALV